MTSERETPTRMRAGTAIIVLVVAVVAAGCSSDGPDTPPSSAATSAPSAPSSAPTASPSATPASTPPPSSSAPSSPQAWPLSLEQTNFQAYVEPVNDAMGDYRDLGSRPALKPLRRACSRIAGTLATAARLLAAGQWTADVRPKIDLLVAGLARERAGWVLCANADTLQTAYRATRERYRASGRSEQVRIALGLPAVK